MTDENDKKETPETPETSEASETPETPETPKAEETSETTTESAAEPSENEATPGEDTVSASASQATYSAAPEPEGYPGGTWLRALHMIIFLILFGVAETLLFFMTVFQFLWMLFAKKRNPSIAQFGDQVAEWLRHVGRFQTGASDNKPFPWSETK